MPRTNEQRVPTRQRAGGSLHSTRVRILGWCLLLLAGSTVASLVVIRHIVLVRLDERLDRDLVQEVREFERLVGGVNPATAQPFGPDLQGIADVYLARNIFGEGEAVLVLVDGQPYRASFGADYPLEDLEQAVARWAALREPSRGRVATPVGELRYLAVPVLLGGAPRGTFVSAVYPAEEREEVDEAMRAAATVSLATLTVASLAAWVVAGRVLAPIRVLTETARHIGESNLSRRIEARGDDELAELAETFNAMLGRLEEAFSSQQAFLDDASHELRTPITIIRGQLELMGEDPEERRQTVRIVTEELDRMSRLVDDLLTLAKADRPDFLRLETVEIAEFTEAMVSRVSNLAPRHWQTESVGHGVVVADRHRLTQAVMNLADNAARYTTDGTPVFLGSSIDGSEARMWVRDNGPGVHPEDQPRLFERFVRGTSGAGRREGAGLGLAIVRAVAEAHGGRVEVASRPGTGATFTVIVPVDPPQETALR